MMLVKMSSSTFFLRYSKLNIKRGNVLYEINQFNLINISPFISVKRLEDNIKVSFTYIVRSEETIMNHSDSDTEDLADLRRWALLESSNWNLESKSKGAARAGLGEASRRPPEPTAASKPERREDKLHWRDSRQAED